MRSSNPTPVYPAKGNEIATWKRCMHPMLTAALFTRAKTWKLPKCPSTGEWIKTMWHTYTMEYYWTLKKEGNPAIWDNVDEPRESYAG